MIRDQYFRVVVSGLTAKEKRDAADKEANVMVLSDVLFDFDKYEVRADGTATLEQAYKFLTDRPELSFELSGHTDHIGPDVYNQWLSEMRAKAVRDWLVGRGIQERRLIVKGYGESKPVAMPQRNPDGTDNPANRQKNRRVELRELKKAYDETLAESANGAPDTFIDITNEVVDRPTWEDEDGLIQTFSFTMRDTSMWTDVITIGLGVDFYGGDLLRSKLLFQGSIRRIEPRFTDYGEVELDITCHGKEWDGLSRTPRDLFYPQVNHPRKWAQSSLTLATLVENLCRDAGYEKGDVRFVLNPTYTLEKPIRQSKMTDWLFLQRLAVTAKSTFWTHVKEGKRYYNFVGVAEQKAQVASSLSFYYPLREVGVFQITESDAGMIQMRNVNVSLAPDEVDHVARPKKKTDTDTGEDVVEQEEYNDETRQWETWVLDMAKVRALSEEEQDRILAVWEAGNLAWEDGDGKSGVKKFFKRLGDDYVPIPSRVPTPAEEQFFDQLGDLAPTGTSRKNIVATSLPAQDPNVSGYKFREDLLGKETPERRSEILYKYQQGTLTSDPEWGTVFKKYFEPIYKKDTAGEDKAEVPEPETAEAGNDDKKKPKLEKATKRDAGFRITCTVDGNFDIVTKQSYLIRGLSNYSGVYYLYRVSCTWGDSGFEMHLTFTR